MLKKISVLFSTLVLVIGMGISGSVSAAAAPQNCNGEILVSANYVRDNAGTIKGAIQLCREQDSDYWFAMFFYYGNPIPTGHIGTARLFQRRDTGGAEELTNCADGTGNASTTMTWCSTSHVFTGTPTLYRARGELLSNRTGSWVKYAEGYTLLCSNIGCVEG